MRDAQAVACASCDRCGAEIGQHCITEIKGTETRPHRVRRNKAALFIAQAYCAGEFPDTGIGCGTEGCETCGGPDETA